MSPFQHGEVFVTEDGAETDLDLGHYERFLDTELNKHSSYTSGKLYEEMVDLPLEPAKFAGDAVVFVVAKDSPKNSISVQEIKNELQSDEKNIIFDGVNASNFNFVAQKLNLPTQKIKYSLIKGNKGIVEQINKFPNSIGVISLNTISNPYSREAEDLRKQIKILSVTEKDRKSTRLNSSHLKLSRMPSSA